MPNSVRTGLPIIGVIFLALAVFKFLNGGPWVVWAILAFLFGGFGIFGRTKGDGA